MHTDRTRADVVGDTACRFDPATHNGRQVYRSTGFTANHFTLKNQAPLQIGMGMQEHFDGLLSDVRIYRGTVDPARLRMMDCRLTL